MNFDASKTTFLIASIWNHKIFNFVDYQSGVSRSKSTSNVKILKLILLCIIFKNIIKRVDRCFEVSKN